MSNVNNYNDACTPTTVGSNYHSKEEKREPLQVTLFQGVLVCFLYISLVFIIHPFVFGGLSALMLLVGHELILNKELEPRVRPVKKIIVYDDETISIDGQFVESWQSRTQILQLQQIKKRYDRHLQRLSNCRK